MALVPASSGKPLLNTPRLQARRKVLQEAFSIAAMDRAWTKYVRPGLRDQEILDLHDYNDFHWGRRTYFESLRSEILAGSYVPRSAMPVRVEKANGVNRTLIIPSPQDAVVLQCIVEHILKRVLAKQPSKNAFFSRSHGFAGGKIDFDAAYIWFRRWRVFSKRRLSMASSYSHLCTTDVANYFDNIDYTHLRNVLSSVARIDEVILDVLFRVIDGISWRPDYLPPPGRSLPQVNFDAPRLLAHAYLYEIDRHLKYKTEDSFLRWVDDITVPANSYEEAKATARDLDQILMTRGLRLNAGKTRILNAKQASEYFFRNENAYLDGETAKIKLFADKPGRMKILSKRLQKNFNNFISRRPDGQWDKVAKRYISLFASMKDDAILSYCSSAIATQPTLRESIWRYFESLGPSNVTFDILRKYILGNNALDDASVFQAANVIVGWKIKPTSTLHKNAKSLGITISQKIYLERSPSYFLSSLCLTTKYGFANNLHDVLIASKDHWSVSEALSRQVAATLPKFRTSRFGLSHRRSIEAHKLPAANSVLMSLDRIYEDAPVLKSEVRMYVLNGLNKSAYGLDRFLLALHVLLCKKLPVGIRRKLKSDLLIYIEDPLYSKVIKSIKP